MEDKRENEINRLIDYLYQQSYQLDRDISDDDYYFLFEYIYNYFLKKNNIDIYFYVVSKYISKIIINNEIINLAVFINNLDFLFDIDDISHNDILKKKIRKLKFNFTSQIKTLKVN